MSEEPSFWCPPLTIPEWAPPGYGAPLLVVLSGPTAVGKTSVLRRMQEFGLPYHVGITATTRPRRSNEEDGQDYYFVTDARFQQMLAANDLLEHARVHGMYDYGVPATPIREALERGLDVIIPPEVQGAATLRGRVPGLLTIFMAAPTFADLERRIRLRGTERSEEEIQTRLATARREMERVHEFDYLVINDDGRLDDTVRELDIIIQAEKRRVGRRALEV